MDPHRRNLTARAPSAAPDRQLEPTRPSITLGPPVQEPLEVTLADGSTRTVWRWARRPV